MSFEPVPSPRSQADTRADRGAHSFDKGFVVGALLVRQDVLLDQCGAKVLKLLGALWLQRIQVYVAAKEILRRRQVGILHKPVLACIAKL